MKPVIRSWVSRPKPAPIPTSTATPSARPEVEVPAWLRGGPPWSWFENGTGEGIVQCAVSGMSVRLTVDGTPVLEYRGCGTCSVLFDKVGHAAARLDDGTAADLLGSLEVLPPPETLLRLARPLEARFFRPVLVEGIPKRVEPGTRDDFFAHEAVRLFGDEARPTDAAYYRFGSAFELKGGTTLLTAFAVPLHDPQALDRTRVDHWRAAFAEGRRPTAVALALHDDYSPAATKSGSDPNFPFSSLELLHLCLLDGHHRVQAAAELELPVRVLAFVLGSGPALADAVERFQVRSGDRP